MWHDEPSSSDEPEYFRDAVEISILGPIEVAELGRRLDVGGPKERAALAVLAAWPGDVVSTDRLVDALWGDEPPRTSAKQVQNLVLHLRKTVGRELIETRPAGYVLIADPETVDAHRFELLVTRGREQASDSAPAGAVATFGTALDLWRGAALSELPDWAPACAEAARLDELRRCAEEEQAQAALAVGRHGEWVHRLESLVTSEPLRERRWALLMLAQYRCGRQVDALRSYQRARDALGELGLEPGPELQSIERAISAHDTSLLTPTSGGMAATTLPTGVVSFLLTDIERSSELWERNPMAMADALNEHDRIIESAIASAGGVLLKARGEGDSTFSVFTKTSAAVAAGLAALGALEQQAWPADVSLMVRMAVHTGEAHERDGDYFGPTVNRAARMRSLAQGGQLLLSEAVATLVRDDLPEGWDLVELGEHTLQGQTRPERVFTLTPSGAVVDHRATIVARSCPYMGLLPFQPEDDRVFFGRSAVLQDLLGRLRESRFTAIVGASGSGKSSLLRAGLVARLQHEDVDDGSWLTVVLSPGSRPLSELAAHLGPLCGDSAADLLHDLESDTRALDVAVRQALAMQAPNGRVALVIDQLEELYTLCRDDRERDQFLDALTDATSIDDGRTVIVVALRADFFAHAAMHSSFARLLEGHTLLVGPMDDEELREVIEGPARVAGLSLEPGLSDVILRDIAGEPGDLPLLSHALLEVWSRREGRTMTIAGYRASGGVTGAIAHTADAVYDALDPEQQRIARAIFVRLTELGEGTEDTRRRATLDEITGRDPLQRAQVDRVLDVLASARLVTISEDTVEVSHEALIRSWPRLRSWLDDDREGLRIMRHVTYSARDWADRGRDDSELYRGPRLEAALEWRTGHDADLNPLENEFLDAGERVLAEETDARARTNRRLRTLLVGTGIALVIALIAGALAVNQRNRANDARDRETAVANAETVRRLAVQSEQQQSTSLDRALLLAVEADRRIDSAESRGALQSALMSNPQLLGFLYGTSNSYWSVTFSSTGLIAGGGFDGKVDVWRASDRRLIGSFSVGSDHVVAAFSPTGDVLAAESDSDHRLSLWDATTQERLGDPLPTTTLVQARVSSLAFSPDGGKVSAAVDSGEIVTWDVATHNESGVRLRSDDGAPFTALAYSPDGRLIVAATIGGHVVLYDAATHAPSNTHLEPGPTNHPENLTFDPTSSRIAGGFSGQKGFVWDVGTGELVPSDGLDGFFIWRTAYSPDGNTMAIGTNVDSVEIADAHHLQTPPASVRTQGGVVFDMKFSPDGQYVATANANGSISLVAIGRTRKLGRPLPTAPLQWGFFSPDGSMMASPNYDDGSLSLFDAHTGKLLHRLTPPGMQPIKVLVVVIPAFSPDNKFVAIGGFTSRIAIFDVATGELVRTIAQSPQTTKHAYIDPTLIPPYVGRLTYSPDGGKIIAGDFESATVFDVQSGRPLGTMSGWDYVALNLTYTRDGSKILIAGLLSPSRLFDADTLAPIGPAIGDNTTDESYLGPGNTVVSTDAAGHLRVIDMDTRAQLGPTIAGQPAQAATVEILPGGRELIASFFTTPDGEADIYDIATGQRIGSPFPSLGPYGAASLSPDGKTLISGDGSGMMAWDLDFSHWRDLACAAAGRNLTRAEWSQYLPADEPYRATCPQFPS